MPLVTLPDQSWVDRVGTIEGIEVVGWDMRSPHPRADEIEVVVPPYLGSGTLERLSDLPKLRLIQLLVAGYETALPYVPDGVWLANARGVHDASTAELAVGLAIAALRGLPEMTRGQDQGRWAQADLGIRRSLADRRVLILGYGSIGVAIARRLLPFETTVTAVASRARAGDDLVDTVHGMAELDELLPEHDIVVVVVPLTDDTKGLVGARFLAAMPDGALLVNVARGPVVDTDALIEQTRSGRLYAAVDVTDPEPLPDGHPLFGVPNVLVSPHAGGASTAMAPRAAALLRSQLRAYQQGEPLANLVVGG